MEIIFLCVLLLGNGRIYFVEESKQETNLMELFGKQIFSAYGYVLSKLWAFESKVLYRKCQSTLIIDRLYNSAHNIEDCRRKQRAKERKPRF